MMNRKDAVHRLLKVMAFEVFESIRELESSFEERWVPAVEVKNSLDLNFIAVPKDNAQYGEKGWLFAILARILEDEGVVAYKKEGNRAFYRSVK